jgi:gas vesicle protein
MFVRRLTLIFISIAWLFINKNLKIRSMTLQKLENATKLMKAQLNFLASQQKQQLNINKKIIVHSKDVLKNVSKIKGRHSESTNRFKDFNTRYTFQVNSHLNNS